MARMRTARQHECSQPTTQLAASYSLCWSLSVMPRGPRRSSRSAGGGTPYVPRGRGRGRSRGRCRGRGRGRGRGGTGEAVSPARDPEPTQSGGDDQPQNPGDVDGDQLQVTLPVDRLLSLIRGEIENASRPRASSHDQMTPHSQGEYYFTYYPYKHVKK